MVVIMNWVFYGRESWICNFFDHESWIYEKSGVNREVKIKWREREFTKKVAWFVKLRKKVAWIVELRSPGRASLMKLSHHWYMYLHVTLYTVIKHCTTSKSALLTKWSPKNRCGYYTYLLVCSNSSQENSSLQRRTCLNTVLIFSIMRIWWFEIDQSSG